jgi:hypothetical protein
MIDALAGMAAAVLGIAGMVGFDPEGMIGIATVVLGAALFIQGGTIVSEYANVMGTTGTSSSIEGVGSEGLPVMFVVGAGGIVLGVLALLRIAPEALTAIAVIAFGSAMILSSSVVRQLYAIQWRALHTAPPRSGNELVAGQMAAGSAGVQLLAGLAATVLGILAVVGHNARVLTLAALLLLGVTVLLTGSTLSGLVLSFTRSAHLEGRRV